MINSFRFFRALSTTTASAFGQAHPSSHRHLLKNPDEINAGLLRSEFVNRRINLARKILELSHFEDRKKTHLIMIPSARKQYMIDKIPYFFRQDTDFRYLTGCLQPDCLLLMEIINESVVTSTLFMQETNSREEKWEGPRTKPEEAVDFFGVEQSFPFSELESYLDKTNGKSSNYWYDYVNPTNVRVHKMIMDFFHGDPAKKRHIEVPRRALHELRLFKSPAEVDLMRQSAQIASEAIAAAMKVTKHLETEAQVFATIDYECRMKGAPFLAYPPVVAAGANSNIIHYTSNDQSLRYRSDDETILVDAGCEYHGYVSDITRTWPQNGTFEKHRQMIYEAVLDVQLKLLEQLNRNDQTIDGLYRSMQIHLGTNLKEVGLIPSHVSGVELSSLTHEFCPHHVSHYLGMDVHDTPLIPRSVLLKPGMVISVEPGIYIPLNNKKVPEEFRGIGIRIEDDVLITENGYEVLSHSCPKTVLDIERQCQ